MCCPGPVIVTAQLFKEGMRVIQTYHFEGYLAPKFIIGELNHIILCANIISIAFLLI